MLPKISMADLADTLIKLDKDCLRGYSIKISESIGEKTCYGVVRGGIINDCGCAALLVDVTDWWCSIHEDSLTFPVMTDDMFPYGTARTPSFVGSYEVWSHVSYCGNRKGDEDHKLNIGVSVIEIED